MQVHQLIKNLESQQQRATHTYTHSYAPTNTHAYAVRSTHTHSQTHMRMQSAAEDDLRASRVAQQQRAEAEASVLKSELRSVEAALWQTQKDLAVSKAE